MTDLVLQDSRKGFGGVSSVFSSLCSSPLERLVLGLAVSAMYFFLARAGMALATLTNEIAIIWPAIGFAIAAVWHLGSRVIPFIFLGELASTLQVNSPALAIALAIGNIVAIWVGTGWFFSVRLPLPLFRSPRNFVYFILLCALLPAFISASIGVTSLCIAGLLAPDQAQAAWYTWLLGDATGVVVVAPFLLAIRTLDKSLRKDAALRGAGVFGVLSLTGWVVFGSSASTFEYPLGFVLVPVLAWAAYVLSQRELVTTIFFGSCYAIWATMSGHGPFVGNGTAHGLILLQLFIFVMSTTAFIVHTIATNQRHIVTSLELTQDAAILSLASLAETRDTETGAHIMRTREYVRLLAEQLRYHVRFKDFLTTYRINLLYKSAPLHDMGKVGVPDAILCKTGKVTSEEFEEIKKHPIYGRDALRNATAVLGKNSFLKIAEEIILTHHERWDGSGYPYGLSGEEIPISGRLMALADVYDALTTARCYKAAMGHEEARTIIIEGRGKHFDPAVVDAFLRKEREFIAVSSRYAESGANSSLSVCC